VTVHVNILERTIDLLVKVTIHNGMTGLSAAVLQYS